MATLYLLLQTKIKVTLQCVNGISNYLCVYVREAVIKVVL